MSPLTSFSFSLERSYCSRGGNPCETPPKKSSKENKVSKDSKDSTRECDPYCMTLFNGYLLCLPPREKS